MIVIIILCLRLLLVQNQIKQIHCEDVLNEKIFISYVDSEMSEEPTSLTEEDFLSAKNPPPDEEIDPNKVLREDLVEGDIGLSRSSFGQSIGEASVEPRESNVHWKEGVGTKEFIIQWKGVVRDRYKLWPNGIVPYVISRRYGSEGRSKIAAAIADFHRKTCVRFVRRTTERDYLYIQPLDGCYSMGIGRSGGQQTVSLQAGCFVHGIIIHELMHSLGFFHEHNRNDRDYYIKVHWEDIIYGMRSNFEKKDLQTIDHLGTTYDYGSVMHYAQDSFSRSGRQTISRLHHGPSLGQRRGFSTSDLKRINLLYCQGRKPEAERPPTDIDLEPGELHRGPPCYENMPTDRLHTTILIKVKRGCYRMVQLRGKIMVAGCNSRGGVTKLITRSRRTANYEARELRSSGLRRCFGESTIISPTPPPFWSWRDEESQEKR